MPDKEEDSYWGNGVASIRLLRFALSWYVDVDKGFRGSQFLRNRVCSATMAGQAA